MDALITRRGTFNLSLPSTTPAPITTPWVRNPSWPACDASPGDNKVIGLYQVHPDDGNFFAVTVSGAYTVNYGNGTVTDYSSGSTAYYMFDYNDANLVNTDAPVTFTASTNTVNRTAHGYTNGMPVKFYNIQTTTGIIPDKTYYVTNATSDTFQILDEPIWDALRTRDTTPTGIFLSDNGTDLYEIGSAVDSVNQYQLQQSEKLSTASLIITKSIGSEETLPSGLYFSPDGTKMYVIGTTGDDVNEYALSTAWDISSANYTQNFSVSAQDITPQDIHFKPDGTKMYVLGGTGQDVNEYALSTAWNISSASYTQNFSVSAQESDPRGLYFKPDGTKMYVIGTTGDDVNEYALSIAWDLSSANYTQNFSVSEQITSPEAIQFNSAGTKMYILDSVTDASYTYTLNTAWDITTASLFTPQTNTGIVDFVNDGTATLLPYKIATITITPQTGQSLTSINFAVKHNQSGLNNLYNTGWCDLAIASSTITGLTLYSTTTVRLNSLEKINLVELGNITNGASLFRELRLLQNVVINSSITTFTDTSNMFSGCYTLQTVSLFNTGAVTNMSNMFSSCLSLQTVPLFDTSAVTNMSSMFSSCYNLQTVPLFDTSAVTSMSNMFSNCYNLQTVPLFNTGAVTNMGGMFSSCYSLQTVPVFNTEQVTDMSSMFSTCYTLQTVPLFNTSLLTNTGSMFLNCTSLQTVPLFDTARVTSMSNMFTNCGRLQTVPVFNTERVTNMDSMFTGCYSLQTVPLFNTSLVTTMSSMFSGCYSLQTVPLFDTARVIIMSSMFSNCRSLQTVPLFNTARVTGMNNMFSFCYGLQTVPLFNTTVVTDMSSMFSNCFRLQTVPLFNTGGVTNMSSMFVNCISLLAVPLFNTFKVTSMNSMFNGCTNLQTVPLFNTGVVTGISNMFSNCSNLLEIPAFNLNSTPNSTSISSMFSSCISLKRIRATPFKYTFSVANCKLSASALNEIYTNLPTVTGQTITVTGNWGTATDNPTIATAKGWTVTG